MANLLARGQEMFSRLMKQSATPAGAIKYRRGAEIIDLTGKAWVGRWVVTELIEEGGASVTWGDRDYMIPAADLVVNGNRFVPEDGHRITEVIDGVERKFDVTHPPGEPAYRWSDPGRTVYRVHTKEVPG